MKQTIIALCSLAILAGCGQANITLQGESWRGHESLPVKGRTGVLINQKLAFGEFHTMDIDRSWTKGGNSYSGIGFRNQVTGEYLNIIGTEYINRKQTIRFALTDNQDRQSSVFCVSRFQAKDLMVGDDKGLLSFGIDLLELKDRRASNVYYAQLYADNGNEPWQLMLNNDLVQRQPKYYSGMVARNRNDYYTIVPVTKVLNNQGEAMQMPFGAMGLEIRDRSGQPLAAINLADKGCVYFIRDLDPEEKFLMANICAALLLQEVIG
jgi:hypothetical protein